MSPTKKHIAAIDVGSNSTHLVIAEVDNLGHIHIVETQKEQSLLAASLTSDECLEADAVARLSLTLKRMADLCGTYGARPRVVGTETLRLARNGREFCQKIFKRSGVSIEVVSGQEEARLIYLGVQLGLDLGSSPTLVLDIGGGSTEVVIGERGDELLSASLKLGCVRLTKDIFSAESYSPSAIKALQRAVEVRLRSISDDIQQVGYERCVCSSGTVKAVKQLSLALGKKEMPESFHGVSLSLMEIQAAYAALSQATTPKDRRSLPGVDPSRADILLAGTAILLEFCRQHGIESWILSSYALREGVLVDEVSRAGEWLQGDPDDVRWRSTRALGRRFGIDESHAHRVTGLALEVFDGLAKNTQLDARWREYLRCATHLHEAGRFLSYSAYHKHSYYLIRHAAMPGLAVQEQEIVALIARYHRKRAPKVSDDDFHGLGEEDIWPIHVCSAILRLAVALDKSRRGLVSRCMCVVTETRIHLTLNHTGREEPQSEVYHFEIERPVLEAILKREIVLQITRQA